MLESIKYLFTLIISIIMTIGCIFLGAIVFSLFSNAFVSIVLGSFAFLLSLKICFSIFDWVFWWI